MGTSDHSGVIAYRRKKKPVRRRKEGKKGGAGRGRERKKQGAVCVRKGVKRRGTTAASQDVLEGRGYSPTFPRVQKKRDVGLSMSIKNT